MNQEVKQGKKSKAQEVMEVTATPAAIAETTAVVEKAKKSPTEVTPVTMTDGRVVNFTGKRKLVKDYVVADHEVTATFDFRNGETRKFIVTKHSPLAMQFIGHGILQKVGDETAGEDDVDDMLVAVDAILARLDKAEWGRERKQGDGFAGASLVIRAVMEATGKDQATVKAFLDKKIEATPGLTRAALYASFRNPASKTAAIIQRLENEKLAKNSSVNADDLLGELG